MIPEPPKEEPPPVLGERVLVNGIPFLYLPELEVRRLLVEVDRLRRQVTELQVRGTELIQEARAAKRRVTELEERLAIADADLERYDPNR